ATWVVATWAAVWPAAIWAVEWPALTGVVVATGVVAAAGPVIGAANGVALGSATSPFTIVSVMDGSSSDQPFSAMPQPMTPAAGKFGRPSGVGNGCGSADPHTTATSEVSSIGGLTAA